jgi:hypothetical protein
VASARDHVLALGEQLATGGKAVLACPYDWMAGGSPVDAWLGGVSRAANSGDCERALRALFGPGGASSGLAVVAEEESLPWHIRLHQRSTSRYLVHLLVLEATGTGEADSG